MLTRKEMRRNELREKQRQGRKNGSKLRAVIIAVARRCPFIVSPSLRSTQIMVRGKLLARWQISRSPFYRSAFLGLVMDQTGPEGSIYHVMSYSVIICLCKGARVRGCRQHRSAEDTQAAPQRRFKISKTSSTLDRPISSKAAVLDTASKLRRIKSIQLCRKPCAMCMFAACRMVAALSMLIDTNIFCSQSLFRRSTPNWSAAMKRSMATSMLISTSSVYKYSRSDRKTRWETCGIVMVFCWASRICPSNIARK
mmetsp:Transcript_59227/g.125521  ORF Transcript_59227/g.125521 Transcript_59227/m.125521 type:complete len:254 (+) Transcript_59227:137-898(+)